RDLRRVSQRRQWNFQLWQPGHRARGAFKRKLGLGSWAGGFRQRRLEGSVRGAGSCARQRRKDRPIASLSGTAMLAINHNGRFERADSGVTVPVAGRGAAFGDLNNDGWEDAVMTSLGGHLLVLINRGGKQHWLVISLRGTRSNRDGLGARVLVNGQTRFATIAGSYLSAGDKRLHFGLGPATTAKIEIVWPSRIHQTLNDVRADQFLEVREPEKP